MLYKRAKEQNTVETYEQKKAKHEEKTTAEFTSGEYARLCRGDNSQVLSNVNVNCLAEIAYSG